MSESKPRKHYTIAAAYDTETTNVGEGAETRAFASCYMVNDLRGVDLAKYVQGRDDNVKFFRHDYEMHDYIDSLVSWGEEKGLIPIVCAYNLMFDMQTLMYELNKRYDMKANAQSSMNVYTLDLEKEGETVLRFWDTYHLEMRGLAAMGETCGLEKATGDWDYSLIRTPETPLTVNEVYYATRDVQVIPAYLRYLLQANEWMKQSDLGFRILTKTSIVRQMAANQIGNQKITKRNGKRMTLSFAFMKLCKKQLPRTFSQYALRKACFRGGFTFTAGVAASRVVNNVASLDVTSMHHAFINGRMVPVHFTKDYPRVLDYYFKQVVNTDLKTVLSRYEKPFDCAFHMRIRFKNIRLKKNSAFDAWQIALIPSGKFRIKQGAGAEYGLDERARFAEEQTRADGWHDSAVNPVFAFGKLYSADYCTIHVSELELWTIAQVYDWDGYECVLGEGTVKWIAPPDYVTLQSNVLFEMKNDAKVINRNYHKGEKYPLDIPATIPDGIRFGLETGSLDEGFFESYYNSTVKGMFNGIYGTMAQDVYKPDYAVSSGELYVDKDTAVTAESWEASQPRKCKVFYNYGLRIVGGSRMHLAIAMILLYERFENRITVTGGDTDSLKIRCDEDVTDVQLLDALKPLHDATTKAIDATMRRVRAYFPEQASTLEGVGLFDIEDCGNSKRWKYHMEAWNKARVSVSQDGKVHVTCAGLSRPLKSYHIETFITQLLDAGVPAYEALPQSLGYNVFVTHDVCHALEHHRPLASEKFHAKVTDYMGQTFEVDAYEAVALYDAGRYLGDTTKRTNADSVKYLREHGLDVDDTERFVEVKDGHAVLKNAEGVIYDTTSGL